MKSLLEFSRQPSTTLPISSQSTTFFSERLLHRLVDDACERQLCTYDSLASTLCFVWELQLFSIVGSTKPSPNRALGDEFRYKISAHSRRSSGKTLCVPFGGARMTLFGVCLGKVASEPMHVMIDMGLRGTRYSWENLRDFKAYLEVMKSCRPFAKLIVE